MDRPKYTTSLVSLFDKDRAPSHDMGRYASSMAKPTHMLIRNEMERSFSTPDTN